MCDVCLVTSGVAPSYILTVHIIVANNNLANAMHAQSGAERQKRARIIESEGGRTSIQNYSEGETTGLTAQQVLLPRA